MSRFYAEVQGNRGKASRQGFKDSGIWSHTRGWDTGVYVNCFVNSEDRDEIHVWKTSGSGNAGDSRKLIAIIYDDGEVELVSNIGSSSNIVIKPSMIQSIGYRGED